MYALLVAEKTSSSLHSGFIQLALACYIFQVLVCNLASFYKYFVILIIQIKQATIRLRNNSLVYFSCLLCARDVEAGGVGDTAPPLFS